MAPSAERGASTPARIAAVLALCWRLRRSRCCSSSAAASGHKYTFLFETGGQLVPGNEVLIAGQPIGTIDSIDLTDDSQAAVERHARPTR